MFVFKKVSERIQIFDLFGTGHFGQVNRIFFEDNSVRVCKCGCVFKREREMEIEEDREKWR